MKKPRSINLLIAHQNTSLEALQRAGWDLESNQGGTYFRHRNGTVRCFPLWVSELISEARRSERKATQRSIRIELGIDDPYSIPT